MTGKMRSVLVAALVLALMSEQVRGVAEDRDASVRSI